MKVKYLLVVLLVAILSVIVYSHYKDKRIEKEAKAYYEVAKDHYKKLEFNSALIILDSLNLKYPTSWDVKYLGEKLRLNVNKKLCSDSISFVTNSINGYVKGGRGSEVVDNELDSLNTLKLELEERYSQILLEENKYQCSQCVTNMRILRGLDNSDDLDW